MRKILGLLLLVTMLAWVPVFGQRTSASVSGVVTDPSGAVVPGARITVFQVSTGTQTIGRTDSGGFYVISNLQPATYELRVEKAGFQGFRQTGVTLQVGQAATIDVKLIVGGATQAVTVSAQPSLVDTRNQTLSYSITPQMTEALPLNGRNVLQLMALAPDTSMHSGADEYSQQEATRPEATAGYVTASGEARENTTGFYLDGGLNEDPYTNVSNVYPNPDAIQEFTFDTNSYNAKYGSRGGGIVNAVTKSGTNQLHGTAFEFVRNGALNARNFFSPSTDTLRRNQYGFSLGGPIQKDKTFWFVSYQGTTYRYGTAAETSFGPTADELNGDWSSTPGQLVNPFTGVAFPGNQVPTSLYSSVSLGVLKYIPSAGSDGLIHYSQTSLENDGQWFGRMDHNFGQKFHVFGSYLFDRLSEPVVVNPTNILTGGASSQWTSQHFALNGAYTFSPTLLTTFNMTYSRVYMTALGTTAFPTLQALGAQFPAWSPAPKGNFGLCVGGWWSCTTFWDGEYDIIRNQYDLMNGWTYVTGKHMLDFGGEYTANQTHGGADYGSNGIPEFFDALSGYSPLDFMLGVNSTFVQDSPNYQAIRNNVPGLYVNDTWKAMRRLTLNLGVRWEPWLPAYDTSALKEGSVFSPAAFAAGVHSTRYPNLPPGYLLPGDPGIPSGLVNSDWKLLDPRVGLAWDVRGNGKTSVRAGFGIYHDEAFAREFGVMASSYPFIESYDITDHAVNAYNPYNGNNPALVLPIPSTATFPSPFQTLGGFSTYYKPPATLQWNFTVEHQIPANVTLRADYEASETYHMFSTNDLNAAVYAPGETLNNIPQYRPFYPVYGGPIWYEETNATANYNALNISLERRMTKGLSLVGGYRWAKCLDEASTASFSVEEYSDPRNRMLDYGLCNSDIASQFKMAAVWNLPTPTKLGFVGRHVLGRWSANGIWTSNDGLPFSIDASTDTLLSGSTTERADIVGNPSLSGGRSTAQTLTEYFNTAAFQNAPFGSAGNSPRNFLRGPGFANLDFSLIKSFPIHKGPFAETQRIDFRAEFFDIFNSPNFGQPGNEVNTTSFGEILSANSNRILQFALKFSF